MTLLKIHSYNRSDDTCSVVCAESLNSSDISLSPLENKLFINDVFFLGKTNNVSIVKSPIREGQVIPGVLVLIGNKTYGRKHKPENGKTYTAKSHKLHCGHLLYKCIPNDTNIPPFLIPYEMKHVSFNKVFTNLYVSFTFDQWDDKHPHGKLSSVIGPVDVLPNFYEYQLLCKSLNISINKLQKQTHQQISGKMGEPLYGVLDNRNSDKVFSIDPEGSKDLDDAMSIRQTSEDTFVISVYIANVTLVIDSLGLWDNLTDRVSTIYLPDKNRPMLPNILSEDCCSLLQNVERPAFIMDITIKNNSIQSVSYANAYIKVKRNFVYEEKELLEYEDYKLMFNVVSKLAPNCEFDIKINDSHDVVEFLMLLMNYLVSKSLLERKQGIFRYSSVNENQSIPQQIRDYIKIWSSVSCNYIKVEQNTDHSILRHELLGINSYLHITSPIRRIVDLINMTLFIQQYFPQICLANSATEFCNKWMERIEFINKSMKSIRKVQNDCKLLELCTNDEEILNGIYDGYLLVRREKTTDQYSYKVYLPELKITTTIRLNKSIQIYTKIKVKLYMFNEEESLTRKIRLHVESSNLGI